MSNPNPPSPLPLAEALAALAESALAAPAPAADFLDLVGPDARRFLNGYVTCDTKSLPAGRLTRGFLTALKGQVLADFDLLAFDDRLRLRLPEGASESIAAHLGKYLLADRVELVPQPGLERWTLRGPAAPALVAGAGWPPPAPGEHGSAPVEAATLRLARMERGGPPRFELWGEAAALAAGLERLRAGAPESWRVGSAEALEVARIEAGELAFGVDFGIDAFPQESGDDGAISFTKGCYLGQEVVARIHYRGGVQRIGRGLRFESGPPPVGTALLHDGREAGRLTSRALSPRCGPIGLALLHRRIGEPPVEIGVEGGGRATVVALPFA